MREKIVGSALLIVGILISVASLFTIGNIQTFAAATYGFALLVTGFLVISESCSIKKAIGSFVFMFLCSMAGLGMNSELRIGYPITMFIAGILYFGGTWKMILWLEPKEAAK